MAHQAKDVVLQDPGLGCRAGLRSWRPSNLFLVGAPTATTVALVMLKNMTWLKNICDISTSTATPISKGTYDQQFGKKKKKKD